MLKVGDICRCSTNLDFLYEILEVSGAVCRIKDVVALNPSFMKDYKLAKSFVHDSETRLFTPIKITKLHCVLWGLNEKL
jgi:hypothetical protein